MCCSLAGLKMSLRTGFCCRNFLAQDKIKSLQFWDGALLPPAVLGWHLLTCNISPPDLRWHLLTSNISPPDVRWHLHLENVFYRQICDSTFSPAIFYFRCAMTPSHLQFYRQMCDGTFSPAIFYRQICDGTLSP